LLRSSNAACRRQWLDCRHLALAFVLASIPGELAVPV
jgi:hypothetical protein